MLAGVGLLGSLGLSVLANTGERSDLVVCGNNLRQVGRAFHMWASDHGGENPWWTSYADGGSYVPFGPPPPGGVINVPGYGSAPAALRANAWVQLREGDADNDGMSDSWEQTHFSTTDRNGTGDFDQDGSTDLAEYLAGTNPVDGQSVLEVLQITSVNTGQRQLIWSAQPGKSYRLEYKTELSGATWISLGQIITATTPTASAFDSAATAEKRFYRVALVQ